MLGVEKVLPTPPRTLVGPADNGDGTATNEYSDGTVETFTIG